MVEAANARQRNAIADRVAEEFEPGADVTTPGAIEHHLREGCQTVYHSVGTCPLRFEA